MRRIKTWLRTCMDQERFNSLSILSIERGITINNDKIFNTFEKQKD